MTHQVTRDFIGYGANPSDPQRAAQDDVDWAAYAPDWTSRTRGRAAKFARLNGG